MNSYQKVGVVLAGGASRRFGEPKALYPLNGKPLFQYSIEALQHITDTVMIISHSELKELVQQQTQYEVRLDHEAVQGFGPLAGIYTAMKNIQSEWYITLPCDTPFITAKIMKQIFSYTEQLPEYDAFIPKVLGKNQPLIAVYHRRCLPKIEQQLQNKQLKMGYLFQAVPTYFIDEKEFSNLAAFRNLNTKEDLS